jgi:formate C-acetyltransferase
VRAVAHLAPAGVRTGNSIFNLSVDERIVSDDESFEKLVALVETYFREGGLHIQLNHVSAEELRAAKVNPNAYKSLRVRVSGFSAYFVGLCESIQDNVIARTEHQSR